jgi:MoxR-like ATPase
VSTAPSPEAAALERELSRLVADFERLRAALCSVHRGRPEVVDQLLWCLFARGHALIEGAPGLGKTTLVKGLAAALGLGFARIQFTPDLMPGDILGTRILEEDERGLRRFGFQPGPIFANVVLADEINRATPRTQSALLEAMQEGQVTTFGTSRTLEEPFCLFATQNPIEMEGTYPLPEAQLDRFLFKIVLGPPGFEALVEVLGGIDAEPPAALFDRGRVLRTLELVRTLPASTEMVELAARTVLATHPAAELAPESVRRHVRYGASPRGGQALLAGARARALFAGRVHVTEADVAAVVAPALRHRVVLGYEGEAAGVEVDGLVAEAFSAARAQT